MKKALWLVAFAAVSCGSDTDEEKKSDEPPGPVPEGSATVTGRALDSNGVGVPNAFVQIQSDPVETTTDPAGAFSAVVPIGEHHLSVSKHGSTFIDTTFTVTAQERVDLGDMSPDLSFVYSRIALRETGYMGQRFHAEQTWCALTIEDDQGRPIHGLGVDDFTVTEAVVSRSDGSVAGQAVIDLPAQAADAWREAGVWEHSRNRTKIDLVLLMDSTGSMGPYAGDIKESAQNLVSLLVANHVDFRVAGARFDSVPAIYFNQTFGFYGDQEIDRLRADIDSELGTAGEGWSPTTAYDALMFTDWLGFREDARKVVVILTDIVPMTVYGTSWYAPSASVATLSAAEIFLLENDIELYFSQNPAAHAGINSYTLPDRNPRASGGQSGLRALAARGLATDLGWPFDEAAFWSQLSPQVTALVDAQTLVSWEDTLGWTSPWSYDPAAFELSVTVEIDDPVRAGETLSASFRLPLEVAETDVVLNIITEEDNNPDWMRADIWRMSGSRPVRYGWQHAPVNGVLQERLTPGRYFVEVYDGGGHGYDDNALRAEARTWIEVGKAPVSFDIVVPVADIRAELSRARGLLRDLDDWRVSGDPFGELCEEAEQWLVDIEEGGISWEEMAALKRFNVALAGYANLTEYAQLETLSAVDDMISIVQDIRDIVKEVKKLKKTTHDEWQIELAGRLLDVVYAVLTRGEFNSRKIALEAALNRLIAYASQQLLDELKAYVIEQFPMDREILGPMTNLTLAAIDFGMRSGSDGDEPDWRPIVEAAQALALDAALVTVRQKIGEQLFDDLVEEIPVDDEYQAAIKGLVQDILNALVRRDHDMKDFQKAIERFAERLGGTMVEERGREQVIADVNAIFDRIQDRLGGFPEVRDFLVGFARDITLEAIPEVRNGRANYEIKNDRVVAILIKHGLYNVILRRYYVEEINRGLNHALLEAKAFDIGPGDTSDWESAMSSDFWDYRHVVDGAQEPAWNALATQEAINSWALGLEGLVNILQAISVPLDFVAALYPDLLDTAERLHGFIAVLDGIQVISQAVEFGLKLECLGDFGNIGEDLYTQAFPH